MAYYVMHNRFLRLDGHVLMFIFCLMQTAGFELCGPGSVGSSSSQGFVHTSSLWSNAMSEGISTAGHVWQLLRNATMVHFPH